LVSGSFAVDLPKKSTEVNGYARLCRVATAPERADAALAFYSNPLAPNRDLAIFN